jgi:hypothetical protein
MTGGTEQFDYPESDPRRHAAYIKQKLSELAQHAREDVGKVSDPKAQALFETTAETLDGLAKAYEHYEQKSEPAWQ